MRAGESASQRREACTLGSRQQWVRRFAWLAIWWMGVVVVAKIHLDSLRMYIIITTFTAMLLSLRQRRRRRIKRADGVAPAAHQSTSVVNAKTRRASAIDSTAVAAHSSSGFASSTQMQCAVFATLKMIGTPAALRAINDESFLARILNSPRDAAMCCCGSGRPFLRCCLTLQEELRHCLSRPCS
ncbi:hypothetical protein TRVL_04311 [Trypanosoma vivax]|nr:hypothetical protein TRVL_04311 [Trypanosoma vivax]